MSRWSILGSTPATLNLEIQRSLAMISPTAQRAMVVIKMGMARMLRQLLPVMQMARACAVWPMMRHFTLTGSTQMGMGFLR